MRRDQKSSRKAFWRGFANAGLVHRKPARCEQCPGHHGVAAGPDPYGIAAKADAAFERMPPSSKGLILQGNRVNNLAAHWAPEFSTPTPHDACLAS
jgi:hypothetical protein